ncbi:MAG: N-acetylmuramoyl-L-alanine amidase [Neisseriaceae bacterium]|nr:N-acetylmuramoyl-L-alanine amidase [Neisseriaceae bacterium]
MSHPKVHMNRRHFLELAAGLPLLSFSVTSLAEGIPSIVAARLWPSETYSRLTLESSQKLNYKHFLLENPNRLVIDLFGLTLNAVVKDINLKLQKNDPYIANIRAAQFSADVVRIVIDLKVAVKPTLFTMPPIATYQHRLVTDLYPAKVSEDDSDPLQALMLEFNRGGLPDTQSIVPVDPTPPPVVTTPPKNTNPNDTRKSKITIMIDPGHGGEDSGAIGPSGLREKDVVLKIARLLKQTINGQAGMRALLTRDEDIFIPLGVRVAKARQVKADLFISIHADAFTTPSASGSSVFALSSSGASSAAGKFLAQTQNASDAIGGVISKGKDPYLNKTLVDLTITATINDGLKLGKQVLGSIAKLNRLHNQKGSVEQAGFAVLKAPDIPSILVETAFISNPNEESKLRDPAFQKKMALAIFEGINRYISQGAVFASR